MPLIKFKHVSSVSSEDPNHPASNLLVQDTYRKWQSSSAGEKQAVVVLELEKSSRIHTVDIGNHGSAFIEVLVGKSSSTSNEDYKVLIVASSFMSPGDSKSWTNISRVRMFGKDKLSKGVCDQNWDLVKIVCTQPFNKNEKYGVSFITLHSPPDPSESATSPTATTPTTDTGTKKLGIFTLKDDVSSLPAGSLFSKKGTEPSTSGPHPTFGSLAAEARKASVQALKEAESQQKRQKVEKSPAGSKHKHQSSVLEPKEAPPTKKQKLKTEDSSIEFDELLKGVVFSLSGFQNPLRGDLRSKGLDMGAKYEPDWGPSSTHLVCAFAGTPKFTQVKAKKGLVVKKDWILACHKAKKRLPASKYRFSSNGDSDDEIDYYDTKETELFKKIAYTSSNTRTTSNTSNTSNTSDKSSRPPRDKEDKGSSSKEETNPPPMEEDDPYGGSTDDECGGTMEYEIEADKNSYHDDSEDRDTEDEIERVKQNEISGSGRGDKSREKVNAAGSATKSLLDLPNFFSQCKFLLYGDFKDADLKLIKRYITAYNGHIEEYMSEKVTHVVSMDAWDDNFDQALSENSSLLFVRPDWVFKCHSKQSLVPYQAFAIAPS